MHAHAPMSTRERTAHVERARTLTHAHNRKGFGNADAVARDFLDVGISSVKKR